MDFGLFLTVTGFAAQSVAVSPGVASADGGRNDRRTAAWLAHVRYEVHGSKHSFVADVRVTEDDTKFPITATIRGVVAQGWLNGTRVTGQYAQIDSCPIPTQGNVFGTICWQGTLHVQRRDRD